MPPVFLVGGDITLKHPLTDFLLHTLAVIRNNDYLLASLPVQRDYYPAPLGMLDCV